MVVAEIVKLGAGIGGLYLTAGLLLALTQGQIAAFSGAPHALAHVVEQVLLIAFCFAVVLTADSLAGGVVGMLSGVSSGAEAVTMWKGLAQLLVDIVLFSTGAGMALFVAGSGVAAQVAGLLGQPNAQATASMRIFLALACGALTLLGVMIANAIITAALGVS